MRRILSRNRVFILAMLVGLLAWIVDTILDYLFFYRGSAFFHLLFTPPPHEIYIRIVILILFGIFGWTISRQHQRDQVARQTLTAMLENFPNGAVMLYDQNLQIQVAGGTGLKDVYLTAEQMIGKTIQEIFPAETVHLIEPAYHQALLGNPSVEIVPYLDRVYRVFTLPIPDPDGEIRSGMVMTQDITQEIETEIAFLESERRFQEIFEKVNLIAITLDLEGKVVFCNDFLLEQTGWNRDQVLGKSWFELFIPESIKKDLQESVFLEVIESGTVQPHYINPIQTREGKQRIISWSNIIFRSPEGNVMGTASIGEDITEREEFKRQLENIFEMSSDLICVAELDSFEFKKINPAFESVLGYTPDELLDKNFLDFVHPDDVETTITQVEEILSRGEKVLNFANRYRCLDGSYRWLQWITNPIPEENLSYSIARDITEQRKIQQELEQHRNHLEELVEIRTNELTTANQELQLTSQRLKTSIADLEAFAYSVSHDLRAPLRGISGFAQILATRHREDLNQQGQEYLDFVVQASNRMGALIDDLLGYARLGQSAVKIQPLNFEHLLDDIQQDLMPKINSTSARIDLKDPPATIKSDPVLLKQICLNLIDNALTYSLPDQPPEISIGFQFDQDWVQITVRDNGIGIPEEHQEKVFDIFQRLQAADEYPGTGIGLALVKKAASLMGGKVSLESTPGAGCIFTVWLPQPEKELLNGS